MKLPFPVTDKGSINNSVSPTVDWTECLFSFVNRTETFFPPTATFYSSDKCQCLSWGRKMRRGRENRVGNRFQSVTLNECVLSRRVTQTLQVQVPSGLWAQQSLGNLGAKGSPFPPQLHLHTDPTASEVKKERGNVSWAPGRRRW